MAVQPGSIGLLRKSPRLVRHERGNRQKVGEEALLLGVSPAEPGDSMQLSIDPAGVELRVKPRTSFIGYSWTG